MSGSDVQVDLHISSMNRVVLPTARARSGSAYELEHVHGHRYRHAADAIGVSSCSMRRDQCCAVEL